MSENSKRLPDRPSELIEVALRDLEAVERRNDLYVVDMGVWHSWDMTPRGDGEGPRCSVCLAGAVMAQTLGADPEADLDPMDFELEHAKLSALNAFRVGDITGGLHRLGLMREGVPVDRNVPPYYRNSGEQFKAAMREMVAELREDGL